MISISELEKKSWEAASGRKTGDIYIEGIREIAERDGITIEEAARHLRRNLHEIGGLEHMDRLNNALEILQEHPEISSIADLE